MLYITTNIIYIFTKIVCLCFVLCEMLELQKNIYITVFIMMLVIKVLWFIKVS